jgi:DNA polymerase-3 subunit gamma/tau
LRDAESLLDQAICWASGPITAEGFSAALGLPSRTVFFALDRAFETGNLSFAFELAQEIFSSGKDPAYFLDLLIEHYHSLLRVHLGCSAEDAIRASAQLYTQEQCLMIIDYLIQWRETLSKVPFKRLFLEMVLLHILRSKSRLEPQALVQRLLDLEARLSQPKTPTSPVPEAVVAAAPPKIEKGQDVQDKINVAEPVPLVSAAPEAVVVATPPKKEAAHPSRYATLLQFAAVELEGIIKK